MDPSKYTVTEILVDSAKPIQFGDDYINDSSKETARRIKSGEATEDRWQDTMPILLNERGEIIDGHHRHAAAIMNGDKTIMAVIPLANP